MFRTRTFEYDPARKAEEDQEGEEEASAQSTAAGLRDKFTTRVQGIFRDVMQSDVGQTGYLKYTKNLEFEGRDAKKRFMAILRKHVDRNIHHSRVRIVRDNPENAMESGKKADSDDLTSPIPVETYIEYRAMPIMFSFERAGPGLASKISGLEVTRTIILSGGSVLAVLKLGSWVALLVAVVAVLSNISEYLGKICA